MVDVVGEGAPEVEIEAPKTSVTPSAPRSPLDLLRGKRAEMDKSLYIDLAVPRWEEVLGRRLWVRYRPGDPGVLAAAVDSREKSHLKLSANGKHGDLQRMTKANADFLVAACVAVYSLELDEEPPAGEFSELDDYPTFSDPQLSEAVGAAPNATETARKVYATDGDLILAANQLLDWSGKVTPQAGGDFLDG